jgi:hypothetical protein
MFAPIRPPDGAESPDAVPVEPREAVSVFICLDAFLSTRHQI